MNRFDARVRYTRMIIEESFLELLRQRPAARVTVTELCQKAQINRATFYRHYLDIPDLLDQMEEQLFAEVRSVLGGYAEGLEAFLVEMMTLMRQQGSRYMVLGSGNGDPDLMAKTLRVCGESALPLLEKSLPRMDEDSRRMLYQFLSCGCGGILTQWVRDGMTRSPEELTAFMLQLCWRTVEGFSGVRQGKI